MNETNAKYRTALNRALGALHLLDDDGVVVTEIHIEAGNFQIQADRAPSCVVPSKVGITIDKVTARNAEICGGHVFWCEPAPAATGAAA